jgi:hypothetical protein
MESKKKIKKEHFWLSCIVIGPITAFLAVFYPALSVLAIVFIIIGVKGILVDIL